LQTHAIGRHKVRIALYKVTVKSENVRYKLAILRKKVYFSLELDII